MKIRFIQPYPDPYNPSRTYQPGWVAEFTDPDGQRAIDAGAAEQVGDDVRSWKYTGATVSTDCVPTGESLTLDDLMSSDNVTATTPMKNRKKE
jgi:hypothetical protein